METALNSVQIFVTVLLVVAVLLQVKGIGSGFFGDAYATFRTRRGFEQTLFRGTVVLVLVFVGMSLARSRVL